MAKLTPKLLDRYPYSQYADPKTIQRGHAYYKENRVWDITLSKKESRAICMVDGTSGEYTVEIEVDQGSGQLYFECDCPYAENNFCKHMIAAALELSEFLKNEDDEFDKEIEAEIFPASRPQASQNWQNKLNTTLATCQVAPVPPTRRSMSPSPSWSVRAWECMVMQVPIAGPILTPSRPSSSNPAIGIAWQAVRSVRPRRSMNSWKQIKDGSRQAKECFSR